MELTTSVLTVESLPVNNNTEVVCIALNMENGEIVQRSPIAYLIIQGKLFKLHVAHEIVVIQC